MSRPTRRFSGREPPPRSDSEDEDEIYRHQRKQRRKSKRWSPERREEERPVIQGLWVHEVDWLKSSSESSSQIIPPPPQFTDSGWRLGDPAHPQWDGGCSCTDACECVTGQSGDTDDCDLEQDSESDSEDDPPVATNLTFDLTQLSSSPSSDLRSPDSAGSLHSLLGVSPCASGDPSLPDAVADVLRGRVTQMAKTWASPVFRNLIKCTLGEWRSSGHLHEGLIFHHVRGGTAAAAAPSPRDSSHLSFSSFRLHGEATPAQRLSLPGGRGVQRPPSHPERLLRRRSLRPGRGDGIHVCRQEGETSEGRQEIQSRVEVSSSSSDPRFH